MNPYFFTSCVRNGDELGVESRNGERGGYAPQRNFLSDGSEGIAER